MENTTFLKIEDIVAENRRRNALLAQGHYDPLMGVGCCGDRVEAGGCRIPRNVLARCPDYLALEPLEQQRQRIMDDFEYWCARCVTIRDKDECCNVPFVLNRPQRRLLAVMEEQRVAGKPVRVILLKARQWGGSTLVQMYLAWMQLVRHTGWNSLICGHQHASSKVIKRMYNLLLRKYPQELLEEGEQLRFTKLEGHPNVQQIESRDSLIITGSARSEDAVRGYDITMAHLSEVAFWKDSPMHRPDDVVRSVCGSVALKPETVIVLESTGDIQGEGLEGEDAKRNIHLVKDAGGLLKVWEQPERDATVRTRYITVVDVGGRSEDSDYSVIAVWRVGNANRKHAIVAQWRGHIDHDLLAWKAMQLSVYYNNALLVVESNTLTNEAARAGQSDYILQRVNRVYGNVYVREGRKLGFHTNIKTKGVAIAYLIADMRDGKYIERDLDAVNEMRDYEEHNDRYGARAGKHDDILMTRAIGLHVLHDKRVNPKSESPGTSLAVDPWFATARQDCF